jgi:hypothetical protein
VLTGSGLRTHDKPSDRATADVYDYDSDSDLEESEDDEAEPEGEPNIAGDDESEQQSPLDRVASRKRYVRSALVQYTDLDSCLDTTDGTSSANIKRTIVVKDGAFQTLSAISFLSLMPLTRPQMESTPVLPLYWTRKICSVGIIRCRRTAKIPRNL